MYIFVRATGIVMMVFGILAMLIGLGIGFNAVARNLDQLESLPTPQNFALINHITSLLSGALVFLQGLAITALGQLMLVFVDIARNTADTTQLLYFMMNDPRLE
jgi:Zn-dependent membrane protease YugP